MAYEIKKDAERVILHVLAGALPSVVGLKVQNCQIISMTCKEYINIAMEVYGSFLYGEIIDAFMSHQINVEDEEKIIVLEITEYKGQPSIIYQQILEALKLFKAEDIYSCHFISYRYKDNNLVGGGIGKIIKYEHAIDHMPSRYGLTPEEIKLFPQWFNEYGCIPYSAYSDIFKNMLRTYEISYMVGIPELEYIMLFSILEMVFGGHFEINYQISRGTGLLLSSNAEQMKKIIKKVKNLYNARSKYVHEGKDVKWEDLFALREIVRKVLIKLIDLNYHVVDRKLSDLKDEICLGGYGSLDEKEENTMTSCKVNN